jgi:(2R)-sulfolactate sulfo-lyase subunit alpha
VRSSAPAQGFFPVRSIGHRGSAQRYHSIDTPPGRASIDTFVHWSMRAMIHFVLHDARDTVAVVVVEGVKAGMALNGWIMDEDKMIGLQARQDIPIGHKVALTDMSPGDTVIKYGIDMGRVVAPIAAGQHAHVHNIKTKRW